MAGLTSNIINDIKKNLSDRYHAGFPIIKELIQNADDATASRFVFGIHLGLAGCKHSLLREPGLWCFNNGKFKTSDKDAISSMGINAKAGESEPIGKFGLGMKSVFHWCESFLYVAHDGQSLDSEFLNPWNNGKNNYLHKDWETAWENHKMDDCVVIQKIFAEYIDNEKSWFFLWIPLRQEHHLPASHNKNKKHGIASGFPGDNIEDLSFLKERDLSIRLGNLLPLLANLKEIRFIVNMEHWKLHEFTTQLQIKSLKESSYITSDGSINVKTKQEEQQLLVWGRRNSNNQPNAQFQQLKNHKVWPEIRYLDDDGEEQIKEDKSSAEGAIFISHQDKVAGKLTLQWAVFLPLEENSHIKEINIPNSSRHYRFMLHGQFFIDAGRRGIHSFTDLATAFSENAEITDEQSLRRIWNQALAQQICLPLILPALNDYAKTYQLKNNEVYNLTMALKDALNQFDYLNHVCRDHVWFRELSSKGGSWQLHKQTDPQRILPLPAPPQDAPNRPWDVLPRLKLLNNTLFKDNDSADISNGIPQWPMETIQQILQEPPRDLFADTVQLDYFHQFLEVINPMLGSGEVQQVLLSFIREAIAHHDQQRIRRNKQKISRIIGHLAPDKRWKFGVLEEKAKGNSSDAVLKALWTCNTKILPVPAYLEGEGDKAATGKLDNDCVKQWLAAIQPFIVQDESALPLTKSIVEAMSQQDRRILLRAKHDWQILSVYSATQQKEIPVSYHDLESAKQNGLLFAFAGKNLHEKVEALAKCLPLEKVLVIRTEDRKIIFDEELSREDDNKALLSSLIINKNQLTENQLKRKALIKKCYDIGSDTNAIIGLRYLLHGNYTQANNIDEILWINAHQQSPAWEKLWRQVTGFKNDTAWQIIDRDLVGVIPSDGWDSLNIQEIKPEAVLAKLVNLSDVSEIKGQAFSKEERNEILEKIENKDLWCRLYWHETFDGKLVNIDDKTYCDTGLKLPEELHLGIKTIINCQDFKNKKQWVKSLDFSAAIMLALQADHPHYYLENILDWLKEAGVRCKEDLLVLLKKTKWLMLSNDHPVSPEEIVNIEGLEDAIQKLASLTNYCYASEKDLQEEICSHSVYAEKVKPLFDSEAKDLLEKLALLINEASEYSLGKISDQDKLEKLAKTLIDCDVAPGWAIIEKVIIKFSEEDCRSYLVKQLTELPSPSTIKQILDWLQSKPVKQSSTAYKFYLQKMVEADCTEQLLPNIKLLANDGKTWMSAKDLCCDVPGVDKAHLLYNDHYVIIQDVITRGGDVSENIESRHQVIEDIFTYLSFLEGLVKPPLLGLLWVLLGQIRDNETKAKAYLYPYSLDTLLTKIQWDVNRDQYTPSGTLVEALTQGFHFTFKANGNIENVIVANLLGDNIIVPVLQESDNLIIKRGNRTLDHKDHSISTTLLFFDKEKIKQQDVTVLTSMVRETCDFLWKDLYGQKVSGLNNLWEALAKSQQLDIAVTRSIILNHAAFYLNTLGATKEAKLKNILKKYKESETRIVESERNSDKKSQDEWQGKLQKSKEELIRVLSVSDVAKYVLDKVKERLVGFQYEPDGILFELFQNADDAVLELARCEAYPEESIEVRPESTQFCVELRSNTLYVLHWGRPINYRGNAEIQAKWSGFEQDLEKMLIVSASGKSDDQQVTGRFGLGFKSVFLACDEPKIISGDLQVKILGGFLPEEWKECTEAQAILREYTQNPRYTGTLVALPLRDDIEPTILLKRFESRQAMLCLASKMLRQIEVNGKNHHWQPKILNNNTHLEFGQLDGKHNIVYRDQVETGLVAVVFGVTARGFGLLTDMPTFWVVAPTRETAALGFIISAPFRIDAGRGKLAGEGEHDIENQMLAKTIGKRFGYALAELYESDWDSLHKQLQLAQNVKTVEWWTSLWRQLKAYDWEQKAPPYHLGHSFICEFLGAWLEKTGQIPNGLSGSQAALVSHTSVHYAFPTSWLEHDAIAILCQWQPFITHYPITGIVADWVLAIWRQIKPDSKITDLDLNKLIEVINDQECDIDTADKLGQLFNIIYKDEKQKPSDDDKKLLADLRFFSKQGNYQISKHLLSLHGADNEEKLRIGFAPDQYILSSRYTKFGKEFFKKCRIRMDVSDYLKNWFINVHEQNREAALRYIIEGDKGNDIAQDVRNDAHGKWFDNISRNHTLLTDWNDNDKEELIRRLSSSSSLGLNTKVLEFCSSTPLAQASLAQIHQWWEEKGRKDHRNKYLSQLYPKGEIPNLAINNNGDYSRKDWMLLFSIGVFQRLGRVRDFGTRGFIEYLQQQGWWDIFCTNPRENGEGWLNMLYEYSENQSYDEKYSYWMTMLPNLFKISLKLDEYVNLFEGIQHRQQDQIPNVLRPNLDPLLQGAGFGNISPINRTLRKGFNLVVRELLRAKIIDNPEAHTYAYMPAPRVQRILDQLSDYENSISIYQSLCNAIGEKKAIFGGDFDIPLLILASNKDLLNQIAGIELEYDEAEELFV